MLLMVILYDAVDWRKCCKQDLWRGREEVDTERGVKLTDSYKPEQFQTPCSYTPSSLLNRRPPVGSVSSPVIPPLSFMSAFSFTDSLYSKCDPISWGQFICLIWRDVIHAPKTGKALRLSVSFSDTQKDSGYRRTERRVECLASCLGSGSLGTTAGHLLGWPKSSKPENWTTGCLGENACHCGRCSN